MVNSINHSRHSSFRTCLNFGKLSLFEHFRLSVFAAWTQQKYISMPTMYKCGWGSVQIAFYPVAPSSAPCKCRWERMCLRVSSSCVSCPIRICSFWFSSCSCKALCWVTTMRLRALSRLFLTAMLFRSRRRRYSTLSLLMLLLATGARKDGRRKGEKSCGAEREICWSCREAGWQWLWEVRC